MALMAPGVISDDEMRRLIEDYRPGGLTWIRESRFWVSEIGHWPKDEPSFLWFRARPHTDDMMAMLDDLGIEPPAVIEPPEWIDGWALLTDMRQQVIDITGLDDLDA